MLQKTKIMKIKNFVQRFILSKTVYALLLVTGLAYAASFSEGRTLSTMVSGRVVKLVDENNDGIADKKYTQQCFGSTPGGLWSITKPTREDQEYFFFNAVLAIR